MFSFMPQRRHSQHDSAKFLQCGCDCRHYTVVRDSTYKHASENDVWNMYAIPTVLNDSQHLLTLLFEKANELFKMFYRVNCKKFSTSGVFLVQLI